MPQVVRRDVVALPQDRRRREPDVAGSGRRSDVFTQGCAQRGRKGDESVAQALFAVEPLEDGLPLPSL